MTSKLSGDLGPERAAAATMPWPGSVFKRWRESPERLAWLVILFSFAVFVLLAVFIPWAVSYTIQYLPVSQSARLDPSLESFF